MSHAGEEQVSAGLVELRDPAERWRVLSGAAELFLQVRGGPRHHLMSIGPGQLVNGLGELEDAYVLASVGSSSRLVRETGAVDPQALEGWISTLLEGIAKGSGLGPGPRALRLRAGETTGLDRLPVTSVEGLVWVRTPDCACRIFGDLGLPEVSAGEWTPLTPGAWLMPEAPAAFTATGTPGLSEAGELEPALSGFYRRVLARWLARQRALEAEHALLASRSQQSDRQRMQLALAQLSAPETGETVVQAEAPWEDCLRKIAGEERFAVQIVAGSRIGSIDEAAALAAASGVRVRRVLLELAWWKVDHGSLLAQLREGDAPVALLYDRRLARYRVFDPADGGWRRVNGDVAATLGPAALTFYPPLPIAPASGRELLRFAFEGLEPELWRVLWVSLGSAVLALALPVVTGRVYDDILPHAQAGQLTLVVAVLLVTTAAVSVLNVARSLMVLRIESKVDARLQSALWSRLLDLPASFLRGYSAGDLAMRGLGVQEVREALTGAVSNSILGGVFSVLTLALLLSYNVSLALVGVGLLLITVAATVTLSALQVRELRSRGAVAGRLTGVTLGLIEGIAKLRVAAAESRAFGAWAALYRRQVAHEVRVRRARNLMQAFNAAWLPMCTALLFAWYLIERRHAALLPAGAAPAAMTPGDLVAFLAGFGIMLRAMLGLAAGAMDMLVAIPAYQRARPILDAIPETRRSGSGETPLSGEIELRDVVFRYSADRPPVLRGISLRIRAGEFVAVVGASGSGKSTLLRMLLGFEQPSSGGVLFDGRDLRSLDVRWLRRQMGVVLQHARLRAGSLASNILGEDGGSLDDAWEAARLAGLAADIEAMPMGMHTVVNEGGGTLSGGQRQRLMIARALVRRPRLVLFDEATSALDNHTQAAVTRSLEAMQATRVVIAHRLSTIERADRIVVLEEGRIVEQGRYEELMARDGFFAKLARRQLM